MYFKKNDLEKTILYWQDILWFLRVVRFSNGITFERGEIHVKIAVFFVAYRPELTTDPNKENVSY